jgi:phosphoserine phosphatase
MSVDKNGDFTGLILVSAIDKPGITSDVLNTLAQFSVQILDIKQIITGERLLQTILIKLLPDHALAIESDLMELATNSSIDLAIDFSPYVQNKLQEHAFITVVDPQLDPKKIAKVATFIHGIKANILDISFKRLSELTGITFKLTMEGLNYEQIQKQIKEMSLSEDIDLCLTTQAFQNSKKLFVFDMDSTLIAQEVIDQLAIKANKSDEVAQITASAMNGDIDFEESLRKRVSLLTGLPATALNETSSSLTFNPGVIQTIQTIREMGHKVAVVSGGFSDVIAEPLAKISIDYLYANKLDVTGSSLSGKLTGQIIDGIGKADALRKTAELESVSMQNTIAVGDGANDLQMMAIAGYSFAYNAKEIVKQSAKSTISHSDMRALILLLNL